MISKSKEKKWDALTESVRILLLDRIRKTEKENKYPDDVIMFIVSKKYRGEKTMKLNLLFIVMDLLTLLAYAIVFVHGKLRQFSKLKESMPLVNLLVSGSATAGR